MSKLTPIKAIRAKCLDCSCGRTGWENVLQRIQTSMKRTENKKVEIANTFL